MDEGLIREMLKSQLSSGKCSKALVREIIYKTQNDQKFFPTAVIGAIAALEKGQTGDVKPPTSFRRDPLRGLMQKHWMQPSNISQNMANAINAAARDGKIVAVEPDQTLNIQDTVKNVKSAFDERVTDGKMTGEWLVYAETPAGNRYLTLGEHAEDDEIVAARARIAASEFSEVSWS